MKFKLGSVEMDGIRVVDLEIEGNVSEYVKVVTGAQAVSVQTLSELVKVLVQGSQAVRAEMVAWAETCDQWEE